MYLFRLGSRGKTSLHEFTSLVIGFLVVKFLVTLYPGPKSRSMITHSYSQVTPPPHFFFPLRTEAETGFLVSSLLCRQLLCFISESVFQLSHFAGTQSPVSDFLTKTLNVDFCPLGIPRVPSAFPLFLWFHFSLFLHPFGDFL